jgi:hypothetical protein
MSKSHNKKRNVGIIYEQLVRKVSESLVNGDMNRANTILDILKNNFKKDTELYKEFRLFNALVKTTVSSDSIATRILSEAKDAAQDHNAGVLRKEKSRLIKEINHTLDDNDFYSTRIESYKTYATIQTLLNDWRTGTSADIKRVALYEDKIHSWLITEKNDCELEDMRTNNIDKLTVKIMREKFNKRYGKSLTENQQLLIREMVFKKETEDSEPVKALMTSQKEEVISMIQTYERNCTSKYSLKKVPLVLEAVRSLDTNDLSDENIAKFLTAIKLGTELTEKSNE